MSLELSNGSVASSVPDAARKMAEDLLRGVVGFEVEADGTGNSSDPNWRHNFLSNMQNVLTLYEFNYKYFTDK